MRTLYRASVVVFLALGLFGGGACAWSVVAGPDGPMGVLRDSFSSLVEEWNKHDELDKITEMLVQRNFQKSAIIEQLIEGKIDLRQAVAEFEAVMEQASVLERTPEVDDLAEESDAVRNLLTWLQQEMTSRPNEKPLLLRFQRELRRAYPKYLGT